MVKLCVVHEEGAKRDEAAKQDPGGVTAPLLTNPWLSCYQKSGFFPGFWLWFTETVRPIKKIQNIWFNGQCFRTTYLLVSLTRISPTAYLFFTLSGWAFMMHLSLNGAIVCKPDCVSTEVCTCRLRLYLPKSYILPKNSFYI